MISDIQLPGFRATPEYLSNLKTTVNAPENPIMYLSCDPGKGNGVCGYDSKFYLQFMLNIQSTDINLFLHQFEHVKTCILEGYRLYPNKIKEQIYSDLETPRVIGRFESWAEIKGVELIMQPASIKNTGYKWIQKKPPAVKSKQNPMDAHVHFMYWAITEGKVKAKRNPNTGEILFMSE